MQDIYLYKKFCYTFTCHFNVLYSRLLFYPVWILALARSYKGSYIRQQRTPGLIVSFRKLLILLTTVPKEKENFSIFSNAKSNNANIMNSANKRVPKSCSLNCKKSNYTIHFCEELVCNDLKFYFLWKYKILKNYKNS